VVSNGYNRLMLTHILTDTSYVPVAAAQPVQRWTWASDRQSKKIQGWKIMPGDCIFVGNHGPYAVKNLLEVNGFIRIFNCHDRHGTLVQLELQPTQWYGYEDAEVKR
jgi:hypothetical protein